VNYIREAIDYLRNYQNVIIAETNLKDKLRELNGSLEGYKGIKYDDLPSGSAVSPDDRVCNLIFSRDKTKENIKENSDVRKKMDVVLKNLEEEKKQLLILAYATDKSEDDILKELNISRATYHRQKGRAIRELAVQLFGIAVIK